MLANAKISIKEFKEFLAIQQERNLQMMAVSQLLGIDFTFSEEEMIANAEEQYTKALQERVVKEVEKWMK